MSNTKARFGIDFVKHSSGMWSFGICFSHFDEETYIYVNFYRYSVSIGKIYKEYDWSESE